MTEADYGYLFCWAENIAGHQREPCSQPDKRDNHDRALIWFNQFCKIMYLTSISFQVPHYDRGRLWLPLLLG